MSSAFSTFLNFPPISFAIFSANAFLSGFAADDAATASGANGGLPGGLPGPNDTHSAICSAVNSSDASAGKDRKKSMVVST